MGFAYKITEYYRIKEHVKEYPWPCQPEPDRTITLYDWDVLTKCADGTYTKHTGLGCVNIGIPPEDVIFVTDKPGTIRG